MFYALICLDYEEKALVSNTEKSTASYSRNAFNNLKSLGADHNQALEAQTPSLNAGS
jgi:hypothetical protein